METEIRGYLAASHFLSETSADWDGIFILDSDCSIHPGIDSLVPRHLVLTFDDIEVLSHGKVPPSKKHISAAIEFAKTSERLLVSCRAGQSRSAAMAFLISAYASSPRDALEILDPHRHRPNRKILELGSELLDLPSLFPEISRWQRRNENHPLDFDAIEKEIEGLLADGVVDLISQRD